MKIKHVVILALLTAGCQPKIKGEADVNVKVQPIEIRHYVALDTTKLEAYYRDQCEKLFTVQSDIDSCTTDDLGKFISQFTFQQ